MKAVGIAGMPYSGKSTLFTALTRMGAAAGHANQAVVDVPDPRLEVLARMEGSAGIARARVRFVEVPGGLTARGLGELRQMDALCLLVRAFGDDADPKAELAALEAELMLADLASLEGGLAKARKQARASTDRARELEALERAHALLDAGRPLREGDFDEGALSSLRGFALLTLKPWVVVANVAEDGGPAARAALGEEAVAVAAALEAEVAEIDPAESTELLAGFGISEPGVERVVAGCYRALDLITFLTADEKEAHAWQVRRGAKAPEAAGVIHSDFERGFIRAEVVSYEDLVRAGSRDAARSKGWLRVEGKDYVVVEGDVLRVRFSL